MTDVVVDLMLGAVIDGKYRITKRLGAGGMGSVYLAHHTELARDVAIKLLHQDLLSSAQARNRFAAEARIAGRLRHENLVGVLDMVELEDGSLAMVCELAKGIGLADLLERVERMSEATAVEVLRGMLRGLGAAHAAGLIHRDLKPDNVVVEELEGGRLRPRIIDFGIALAHNESRHTEIGMVVGTPTYMAPEQAMADQVTARTDLFSLGVIAFELLAGKTPFGLEGVEAALANLSRDMPTFAQRVPGLLIDPVLEAIVKKLVDKRPGHRFASAGEVLAVLDLFEQDYGTAADVMGVAGAVARVAIPRAMTPPPSQRIPRLPTEDPTATDLGITVGRARTRRRERMVSAPIAKLTRDDDDKE